MAMWKLLHIAGLLNSEKHQVKISIQIIIKYVLPVKVRAKHYPRYQAHNLSSRNG